VDGISQCDRSRAAARFDSNSLFERAFKQVEQRGSAQQAVPFDARPTTRLGLKEFGYAIARDLLQEHE
jgi:hypothetical protein